MPTDMALYMRERRLKRREALIALAGGKCVKCGTGNILIELNFDHRDPETKLFNLSGSALDKSWADILVEYTKCDLLCVTCHRIKTAQKGEGGGGQNRIDDCGTEAMYAKGCRCDPCRMARHDARVRRGELKGIRRNLESARIVL